MFGYRHQHHRNRSGLPLKRSTHFHTPTLAQSSSHGRKIQYDGTSEPVVEALLAAGILHKDIVLGFHPAELRQYTDFAIY
ncbi:element excision factor XisI family protein [Nostoc piscinale]|uniref:element excision factor XisI family protein n=1 Tax=Nostoc piscinale TaxID=224012 RepID=UPI0009F99736|nr:element excision factor XisI family protein [Nostoc piscinale]